MHYTDLIDSCQAHLPVRYGKGITTTVPAWCVSAPASFFDGQPKNPMSINLEHRTHSPEVIDSEPHLSRTCKTSFLFAPLAVSVLVRVFSDALVSNGKYNKKNYNMKYHVILGRFKWLINVSPSLEGIRYPRSVYVLSFVCFFFNGCCCCFCIHLRSNLDGF